MVGRYTPLYRGVFCVERIVLNEGFFTWGKMRKKREKEGCRIFGDGIWKEMEEVENEVRVWGLDSLYDFEKSVWSVW